MMGSEAKLPGQKVTLLAIALLISLILNLFLVGLLAGLLPRAHEGSKHFAPLSLVSQNGEYMGEYLTRYLSPGDAATFREAMQAQSDALRQAHRHIHEAVKNATMIYEQGTPDPAALQTALDEVNKAKIEARDVVSKIILDSYPKLSSDGRHILGEMER